MPAASITRADIKTTMATIEKHGRRADDPPRFRDLCMGRA
jgi:hypothetical protein